MRRSQREDGATIVLKAATLSTAPTKASGAWLLPSITLAITRMLRASALGSDGESGGRKNSRPVEPPMFSVRRPPLTNRLPRISMLSLPPLAWIVLDPMSWK